MKLRNYTKNITWNVYVEDEKLREKYGKYVLKKFKYLQDARKFVENRPFLWGSNSVIEAVNNDTRYNMKTEYQYHFYANYSKMQMEWVKYVKFPRNTKRYFKYKKMTKTHILSDINSNKRVELCCAIYGEENFERIKKLYERVLETFTLKTGWDTDKILNLKQGIKTYEHIEDYESDLDKECVDYFNSYSQGWESYSFDEMLGEWKGNVHYWCDRFYYSRFYCMVKQFEILNEKYNSL